MSLADALSATERPTNGPKLTVDASSAGGEFTGLQSDHPIDPSNYEGAFAEVYRLAGLDPDNYRIVDETVKVSAWQQSKRLENGDRDTITLYAYSARFRRVAGAMIPKETVNQWRGALLKAVKKTKRREVEGAGPAYNVLVADPQLGKKRTEEAVQNWTRGINGHEFEIERLISSGVNVSQIHTAFMGDETEGVANNYRNQPHTIELNQSEQLSLDYDMRVWTLKRLAEFGVPLSASSVISNHGEWTRNGGKDPVTSQGDNASTHIARQVQKQFVELEQYGGPKIAWTIGDGDPAVTVNLAGVECYFSHGYIEKGRGTSSETRTRSAIERQILGRTDTLGATPLFFMAHYHHHYSNEFEGRTVFGCPALEAERSSEYMLNQFGVWSPPGMLGMLIGGTAARRWSHVNVH